MRTAHLCVRWALASRGGDGGFWVKLIAVSEKKGCLLVTPEQDSVHLEKARLLNRTLRRVWELQLTS